MIFHLVQWQVEKSTQEEFSNWLKQQCNFSFAAFCSVQKESLLLLLVTHFCKVANYFLLLSNRSSLVAIVSRYSLQKPFAAKILYQSFQKFLVTRYIQNVFLRQHYRSIWTVLKERQYKIHYVNSSASLVFMLQSYKELFKITSRV